MTRAMARRLAGSAAIDVERTKSACFMCVIWPAKASAAIARPELMRISFVRTGLNGATGAYAL